MANSSKPFDITLLTEPRYLNPQPGNAYVENIFLEDHLLRTALEKRGLKVHRTSWDDPDMDWTSTSHAVFRTIWDYFERYQEFSEWLDKTSKKTNFINSLPLVRWNVDKHYLADLQAKGVDIPPTVYIRKGTDRPLQDWVDSTPWEELILKPTVSGTARHTYRFRREEAAEYDTVFRMVIAEEDMMLQEFQHSILTEGEVTLMVFGGKYSHAVRKRAKPGDFRVQDDFGGTVHRHEPSREEIDFAEKAVSMSPSLPVYARVDIMQGEGGRLLVSEMEMIEPELWLRMHPPAAEMLADALVMAMK